MAGSYRHAELPDAAKLFLATSKRKASLPSLVLNIRQKMKELNALVAQLPDEPPAQSAQPKRGSLNHYIAIINGKRHLFSERETDCLDPRKFEFFLDVTRGILFTRSRGSGGTLRRLEETPFKSEDVNTLACLVEHAGTYFSSDNLHRYLEDAEFLERNTLAKRMVRIREAVQGGRLDGPFIRRTSQAHSTVSRSGFAFYFDGSNVSYCLVRLADNFETA